MRPFLPLLAILCWLTLLSASAVSAATPFHGRIKNVHKSKSTDIKLQLSNHQLTYTTPLLTSHHYKFNAVEDGTYTLNVHSLNYVFPTYKVVVDSTKTNAAPTTTSDDDESEQPSTQQLTIVSVSPDSYNDPQSYPLMIYPYTEAEYFYQRTPTDYVAYLKNPMVIMMIITLGMVVIMPRMLNNIDPAELEQIKAQQQQYSLSGLMNTLQGGASSGSGSASAGSGSSSNRRR